MFDELKEKIASRSEQIRNLSRKEQTKKNRNCKTKKIVLDELKNWVRWQTKDSEIKDRVVDIIQSVEQRGKEKNRGWVFLDMLAQSFVCIAPWALFLQHQFSWPRWEQACLAPSLLRLWTHLHFKVRSRTTSSNDPSLKTPEAPLSSSLALLL